MVEFTVISAIFNHGKRFKGWVMNRAILVFGLACLLSACATAPSQTDNNKSMFVTSKFVQSARYQNWQRRMRQYYFYVPVQPKIAVTDSEAQSAKSATSDQQAWAAGWGIFTKKNPDSPFLSYAQYSQKVQDCYSGAAWRC